MKEEKVENQARIILNESSLAYCQFRYSHLRYLDGNLDAAVVLSHLLNLLGMMYRDTQTRKGWIANDLWVELPYKELQERLCMKRFRSRAAVKKLVSKGILETKKGQGNILWVRLDEDQFPGVQSAEKQHSVENSRVSVNSTLECRRPALSTYRVRKNKKKKERRPAGDSVRLSEVFAAEQSLDEKLDVARCKKFYEMVEARHREWYPDFPVPKASEGLKWFAQLRLEYPAELIDRVLDWYCVHVTADFVERALCGKTFYQKFVAIGKRMADCQRGRSGHSAIKEDIIN